MKTQFPRECPNCKNGWILEDRPSEFYGTVREAVDRCSCQKPAVPVMDAKTAASGEEAA